MKISFVGGILIVAFLGFLIISGCTSDTVNNPISSDISSEETPRIVELVDDTPPEIWAKIEKALKEKPIREAVNAAPISYYYDQNAAVCYALKYVYSYNPYYIQYSSDCTNFVSQCLRAGNRPFNGSVQDEWSGWWYCKGCAVDKWFWTKDTHSRSWSVVGDFVYYLVCVDSNNTYYLNQPSKASSLQKGDVIIYDFQGGNPWEHATFVTDMRSGKPYVSYHTTDTLNRAWDTIPYNQVLFFHIY